jgi:hypothetical protein
MRPCAPLSFSSLGAAAWSADALACADFRLGDAGDDLGELPATGIAGHAAAGTAKRYQLLIASAMSVGVVVGGAINAFMETPHQAFHFTSEGWFGEHTYAGGADKASHFVDYTILSKELAFLYEKLGYSRRDSILLGFGVAVAGGLLNEIGDATNKYGFSFEDLTMNALGAGASAAIAAAGLQDLIGFRHGILLPAAGSRTCCQVEGKGRDYSNEIFTADLQLQGIGRLLDWKIGPLRYLLISATYGTKGYPNGAPDSRERQVGIEIGINFNPILNDLGVRRNTWWGYTLHIIFDNFRVPFTAVGFRYDLNSERWIGPDNGNGFAR